MRPSQWFPPVWFGAEFFRCDALLTTVVSMLFLQVCGGFEQLAGRNPSFHQWHRSFLRLFYHRSYFKTFRSAWSLQVLLRCPTC